MTSRAGQALIAEYGHVSRINGDGDRIAKHAAAIEQEVRDDIRARVEAIENRHHPGLDPGEHGGFEGCRRGVLAAISSSSATETCSFEACDLPSGHPGDHAFTPVIPGFRSSATETQDGHGDGADCTNACHDPECIRGHGHFPGSDHTDGVNNWPLPPTETQDGEPEPCDCRLHAPERFETQDGERPEFSITTEGTPEEHARARQMAREHGRFATPTPDDRDREEFAQAAEPIVRWYMEHVADPEVVAKWAGLRASGGTE